MIRSLRVKNFKCFKELDLPLSLLNVFSGINSMGKSTAIQPLLLLRQAYQMGNIEKGLNLNGDLTEIGRGLDFINHSADKEYVEFQLSVEEKELSWRYEYKRDSDYQPVIATNISKSDIEHINLFKPTFSFVSAERIGPRRYYTYSYYDVIEYNQVGVRGEMYVGYLNEHWNKEENKDLIENNHVLHSSSQGSKVLLSNMQGWLSEISPDISLQLKKYDEAGIASLEYVDRGGGSFSPMNVGFGLSYISPIIVSLLKAKKGDLIILENPEAHLHPKGQRVMGELIAKACAGGVQVIVETHSDHLLNGIRLSVKNKVISKEDVRLNFFYREEKKESQLKEWDYKYENIEIMENGKLSHWPENFFDEWDKALEELF